MGYNAVQRERCPALNVQLHLDLVRARNRVVYDTLATPCIVGELPGGGVVVHCEWISRREEKTSTCVMRLCRGLV
jgi:hypothetical protein